nr:MAG TPA: hypothetical protein [Caudoviricetes sp.]DAV55887.1 MAG TPA: hypothetical protein [Caudoviricetes sp.]
MSTTSFSRPKSSKKFLFILAHSSNTIFYEVSPLMLKCLNSFTPYSGQI